MSMKKIVKLASTVGRSSFSKEVSLKDIVAGPDAGLVSATASSYRLTVNILEISGLTSHDVKSPCLKLKVEGVSRRTSEIEKNDNDDGTLKVNQSFTFEINDPQKAELCVRLTGKGLVGWDNFVGACKPIVVKDFLDNADNGDQWLELHSASGKTLRETKIRLHIVGGVAEPEQKITLFVGTWNVGNSRPLEDLSPWLPQDVAYELIVIGTQECEYQPRSPYADCGRDWTQTCKKHIGSRYRLVHTVSRGQMRIAIFVRDDAEKAISSVQSASEATGVGHVIANKGGVCISMKFWDTTLCFVNSHFAAHEGYCEARNDNYREIVREMRVGHQNMDLLNQFHHVFWMGDLNYRLDFSGTEEKPMSPRRRFWHKQVARIIDGNYKELLQYDELLREKSAAKVLYGFNEGNIDFPPTFKMQKDSIDTYSQKRMPAWCDRILWQSLEESDVTLLSYTCCPAISTSDHKPVSAVFALTTHALPFSNSRDRDDHGSRRWHIRFTSLRAYNLHASDMSGYSDPYLVFTGTNLVHEFRSKVKYQTLNPVWDPVKELPVIVLSTFPFKRLEKEHLMIRLLDYDYASTDDTLGFTSIPLGPLVSAFKKGVFEPSFFCVEVLRHGLPAGKLEGNFTLTWEKCDFKKKSKSLVSTLGKKLGVPNALPFHCASQGTRTIS